MSLVTFFRFLVSLFFFGLLGFFLASFLQESEAIIRDPKFGVAALALVLVVVAGFYGLWWAGSKWVNKRWDVLIRDPKFGVAAVLWFLLLLCSFSPAFPRLMGFHRQLFDNIAASAFLYSFKMLGVLSLIVLYDWWQNGLIPWLTAPKQSVHIGQDRMKKIFWK